MSTQIKKMSLSQFMDFMAENIVDTTETVRISEGDVTPREVLEELVNEIPERGFCGRLSRYLTKNKRAIKSFESSFHKQQFASLITSKNCVDTDYMAALYLLTADEATWRSVREFVGKEGIKYDEVITPSGDGYTLFCAAKDLTEGTKHIEFGDLSRLQVVKPSMFILLCKAIAISRFGVGAVGIKPKKPNEEVVIFKLAH